VPVCVTVKVFPAIVSVPVRLTPELLVATMNVAVPVPLPGPGLIIATHATLLTASHGQVDAAVTVLVPEPPSEVNERLVGEIDVVQEPVALCVTVNVFPAMVSVPVRLVVAVLAATRNATVPDADPDAPLVTVSHDVWLAAVQAQPAPVVTALFPVPPSPPKARLVGEMLYVQLAPL
jgi:hypothetical protein